MIKKGDIVLFAKSKDMASRIISIFTQSNYTHVGIVIDILPGKIITAEALANGFTFREYSRYNFMNLIRNKKILLQRSIHPLSNVKKTAKKYKGVSYGWIDILLIGLHGIGIKWKPITDRSKQLICSEAVARILYDTSDKLINFEKEYNKPFYLMTPDDIYRSLFITPVYIQMDYINP